MIDKNPKFIVMNGEGNKVQDAILSILFIWMFQIFFSRFQE